MSKRPWWLPTTAGPEVSTQVTRQPPVLITPQAGGDPALREHLINEYGGRLGQFYHAQARHVALGGLQQHRAVRQLPDARMSYHHNNGQEIVRLEVAPGKLVKPKPVPLQPGREPWDWAWVEIHVPDVSGITTADFAAFLTVPRLAEVHPTDEFPYRGVARLGSGEDDGAVEHKLIAFPPPDPEATPIGTVAAERDEQIASLRVDLRPFVNVPVVVVELYGIVNPTSTASTDIVGSVYGGKQGRVGPFDGNGPVVVNSNFSASPGLFEQYFPTYGTPHDFGESAYYLERYLQDGVYIANATYTGDHWLFGFDPGAWMGSYLPPIGAYGPPSGGDGVYQETYYPGGAVKTRRLRTNRMTLGSTVVDNSDGGQFGAGSYNTSASDYIEFWAPVFSGESVPVPETRTASLRGRLLKGSPPWVYSEVTSGALTSERWEMADRFPERPSLPLFFDHLPLQSSTATDASMYNHFGMPLLGKIMIDRYTGGISFQAA